MARALASSGREKEALVYFEREQRNFPLSGLNAGFALMVAPPQRFAGDRQRRGGAFPHRDGGQRADAG